MSVTIRRVGGHAISGDDFEKALHEIMGHAMDEAALAIIGAGMQVTPVVTGNLRRSWAKEGVEWRGTRGSIRLGPGALYARRVNTVGRSAGYVEKGYQAGEVTAQARLEEGVRRLAGELWSNSR